MDFVRMIRLELKARADLRVPGRAESAGNYAKQSAAKSGSWQIKSRCVCKVEEFSTNLQLHVLSDGEFLAEGEIRIVNSIAT